MKLQARTLSEGLARPKRENFPEQGKRLLDGKSAGIRAKVARAVVNNAPRQNDSREVVGSHTQIRIALVVFKADVVAWAVLFNQIAFEDKSFDFAGGDNRLEVGDFGDHSFDFGGMILVGLKVLANTIF